MNKFTAIIIILITNLILFNTVNSKEQNSKDNNYISQLFNKDNIYIGGQPSKTDLLSLKEAGFTNVINVRTEAEMQGLNFYEDFLLEKAGIPYHLIPIGGDDNPYSPEKLKQFAQAIESSHNGKILLHCRSGHRVSQLWAAYLVKYKNMKPDEALEIVSDLNWWPMPMEKLLGKKLSVSVIE